MKKSQDHFNVLRKIKNRFDTTQREMAKSLNFSLRQLKYIYFLTPKKIVLSSFDQKIPKTFTDIAKLLKMGYITIK